jgi:hypothetical protein
MTRVTLSKPAQEALALAKRLKIVASGVRVSPSGTVTIFDSTGLDVAEAAHAANANAQTRENEAEAALEAWQAQHSA